MTVSTVLRFITSFPDELLPDTNAFDSTAQPKVLATVFERPELPASRLCRGARDFAAAWKRATLGGIASHAWQFRVAAADQLRFLGKAAERRFLALFRALDSDIFDDERRPSSFRVSRARD
jgi:hypothetical protein